MQKPIRGILTEALLLDIMRSRLGTWDTKSLTTRLWARREACLPPAPNHDLVRVAMHRLTQTGLIQQTQHRPARWKLNP